MRDIPTEILSTLQDIASRRLEVMILAARQRAKFEGWLKFELAAALCATGEFRHVRLEPQYGGGRKADLGFEIGGATWCVELKTANANWRTEGVENRTRPITKNVSEIAEDIVKLRTQCPPSSGLMVFALFPVPSRIWTSERDQLTFHLHRIEAESSLREDTLIRHSAFIPIEKQFGIAFFVLQAA